LRGGGVLAVEIDARLGDRVVRALSGAFARVRVEPDLTGRDRVILARAP
jgi:methylase of polypeptide subunit release factors